MAHNERELYEPVPVEEEFSEVGEVGEIGGQGS